MSLIALDPGHGGKDPGAIGPTGLKEKDITLKLALNVGRVLKQHDVDLIYTRTDDRFSPLSQRAGIANEANADFFISIHLNSATSPLAMGTETFSYRQGTCGEKLAQMIQTHLVKATGLVNRGVKQANFAVLRNTKMPAAIVEVCFISNPQEEALLKKPAFSNKATDGISKGILTYLGL